MTTHVLLMAYGTPRTLKEVGPYLRDIRRGREPSPEAVEELTERYRSIGGTSPLLELTNRQAKTLQEALDRTDPGAFEVRVGMKHWHPYIAEAVEGLGEAKRVIGLVLAPHYAKMSIGDYERRVLEARDAAGADFELRMVDCWYDEPLFVELVASRLRETLEGWTDARVYFTAHSLPERILAEGDPYRDQLAESARLVAECAGVGDWDVAFQSASATGEPWIGPDILDALDAYAAEGGKRVVVAPIGFVSDHLEILYDVDVECIDKARQVGLELRRIPSPNEHSGFAAALASVVRRAAS